MIRLKNITKIGDIISADVETIERVPQHYKVSVDVKQNKMVECTAELFDFNAAGAVAKLFKLYMEKGDKLPKSDGAAWY